MYEEMKIRVKIQYILLLQSTPLERNSDKKYRQILNGKLAFLLEDKFNGELSIYQYII